MCLFLAYQNLSVLKHPQRNRTGEKLHCPAQLVVWFYMVWIFSALFKGICIWTSAYLARFSMGHKNHVIQNRQVCQFWKSKLITWIHILPKSNWNLQIHSASLIQVYGRNANVNSSIYIHTSVLPSLTIWLVIKAHIWFQRYRKKPSNPKGNCSIWAQGY